MKTKTLLLAGAVALLCASPAFAASTTTATTTATTVADTGRACLRVGEIYNWKVRDRKSLIIEDNFHKKYQVELLGYCPNLDFHETLAVDSPGSSRLSCLSPGDSLITREVGTGHQRCPVKHASTYTAAMEKADKDAAAAKKADEDHKSTY